LRVLSYNIHKGFNFRNRQFILSKIKEAIDRVHADLVFLQEVQGHHKVHAEREEDWPTNSQFEYLADQIWPHYAYGRNAVYDSGHHGNAILSKYPIQKWSNVSLATRSFERRGLLHATIELPHHAKNLHCICIHLGLSVKERRFQLEELCNFVNSEVGDDEPLLIAGDFNDWSRKASGILEREIESFEVFKHTYGKYALTYPNPYPVLKLDRIYCRGLNVLDAQALGGKSWRGLSDHLALYAQLEV